VRWGQSILAVCCLLAALSPACAQDTAPSDTSVSEAERILSQAQIAGEAATSWLRRQLEGTALERWAQQELDDAMRKAVEEQQRTLGLFIYTPEQGDALDGDWSRPTREQTLEPHIVLLVHGLDEPGDIWDDMAPALAGDGHHVARFNYPNDQAAATSATTLTRILRALRSEHGVQRVDFVCHSMGGLITRDALTRDDRGDITTPGHLVLIGTPNHGSKWAQVQAFGEARDHLARWIERDGKDSGALLGFLVDGTGEAADDLLPGSPFLTELNARPLPRNTPITIIAGKIKPAAARQVGTWLQSPYVRRMLGDEQARTLAANAHDMADSLGDGLVSIESALLEGVDDVVIVEGNHRSILRRIPAMEKLGLADGSTPPAIPIVLNRLDGPPAQGKKPTDTSR
jgi:triacylglycerol esterase/lipase EstA (alpha/beta hydrolase family)